MRLWRTSVITLLRKALLAGILESDMKAIEIEGMLKEQGERWGSLKINRLNREIISCDMQGAT
jgi:hypothetical protein